VLCSCFDALSRWRRYIGILHSSFHGFRPSFVHRPILFAGAPAGLLLHRLLNLRCLLWRFVLPCLLAWPLLGGYATGSRRLRCPLPGIRLASLLVLDTYLIWLL
jgi:hypothetical protein